LEALFFIFLKKKKEKKNSICNLVFFKFYICKNPKLQHAWFDLSQFN
jgi:hypothetical protein